MILTQEQVNRIFDLMRMDSNNFKEPISKELTEQLISIYGLNKAQIESLESTFGSAFRSVYRCLCS